MEHIDSATGEVIESGGYRRSLQFTELMIALAAAQAEFENVEKSAKNEHFGSKYVTLGAALEEIRPKFAAHGLAMCQMPINGEGNNIGVTTLVVHGASGQWIDSTLFAAPTKFDAQGVGSVITYLRRYGAMAMAGLAPEDDDGNAASVAAPTSRAGAPQTQTRMRKQLSGGNGASPSGPPATTYAEALFKDIRAEIDEAGTIAALNSTGIWRDTRESEEAVLAAVKFKTAKGDTTAWERLVERDAARRVSLAEMEPFEQ